MVNCEHQFRLDAYHDGELSPAERTDIDAHLRDCPSCTAVLAAMQRISRPFADTTPPQPSHAQLLQLADNVRSEPANIRMLLRLFRATAVAATVLIASSLAGALYLSQQTRAAAHEAMVLDHVASWSRPAAMANEAAIDHRQAAQHLWLAQWIAEDLQSGQEER